MARQPPPVVEAEEDLVLHEARVDGGHALFQLLVQLQLHPHADEDGRCIHHKPCHAAREELDTLPVRDRNTYNRKRETQESTSLELHR